MALPPDDDTQDDGEGIQEPPIDREGDTRPLKPLLPRREGETSPGRSPAATVLRESGSEAGQRGRFGLPLRPDDSTDKLRLVPKLPNPPAWRAIFVVGDPQSTTIGLDVRQALVIGRGRGDGSQPVGLDLSAHDAVQLGVSRQHAVLIPSAEGLFISDLGSTNGTWINGDFLEPGYRYPLTAGDRIELGLLKLIVRTLALISRSGV